MISILKYISHLLFRLLGFDVIRYYKNTYNTLLGLKKYPIKTILDIGANIGQSAKIYRGIFPDATIYSFEPLPDIYDQLKIYSHTQNGKIIPINIALGDQREDKLMYEGINFSPSSSFLLITDISKNLFPQTENIQEKIVRVDCLDNIAENLSLIPEILIKMDVQGYEKNVIQGGIETLKKAIGCIIEISIFPLYERQPSFTDIKFTQFNWI
jgi:FkbM family methyltransferase